MISKKLYLYSYKVVNITQKEICTKIDCTYVSSLHGTYVNLIFMPTWSIVYISKCTVSLTPSCLHIGSHKEHRYQKLLSLANKKVKDGSTAA